MNAAATDWTHILEALDAIRQELTQLGARVAALEAAIPAPPVPAAPATPPQTESEGLSEELVLVIIAAIAAFLGKKPHIRQIRLLGTAAWAQQGRVMIQASHALPVHHA
jgi:methylmalonyl-CoA carboxyltransferase large subunit